MIELVGHGLQNNTGALVANPACHAATMLGVSPELFGFPDHAV